MHFRNRQTDRQTDTDIVKTEESSVHLENNCLNGRQKMQSYAFNMLTAVNSPGQCSIIISVQLLNARLTMMH